MMTSCPRPRQRATSATSASSQARRISPSSCTRRAEPILTHEPSRRRERGGRSRSPRLTSRWRQVPSDASPTLARSAEDVRLRSPPVAARHRRLSPLPQRGRVRAGYTAGDVCAVVEGLLIPHQPDVSARACRGSSSNTAPTSAGNPAPLTPDNGSTGVPGRHFPRQRPAFFVHLRRIDRVDLVEPDHFRLVGEAVAVIGQLAADRAVGADDVVLGAVDQVQDRGAALDMPEKPRAETGALARPFDQPRQIGEHEFGLIVDPHDAQVADAAS